MKLLTGTQTGVLVLSLVISSGCVTTRKQLNEERAVSNSEKSNSNSVASEDLNPKAEPKLVQSPSSPPTTTPATQPAAQPVAPVYGGGSYSIEELRVEMAKLSGKVEELEHEKKLREDQRAEEQKKLQEKIAELEKQLKEQAPAGPVAPDGKSSFQAGKDAYFNDRFEEAIGFLEKSLASKETPKDTEEATYLLGESFYKLKNYQKAIVAYSQFPEKFTKSSYHPKALLRIAECFEAMNMKEDAKAFYQNLVDQFPKTAEGKLAKKRLSQAPASSPKPTKKR